jgi:hypothetical protein
MKFPTSEVYHECSKPYILLLTNSNNLYPIIYQGYRSRLIELTPRPSVSYNMLINISDIELPMIIPGGISKFTLYSNHGFWISLQRLIGSTENDLFDRILQTQSSLQNLITHN